MAGAREMSLLITSSVLAVVVCLWLWYASRRNTLSPWPTPHAPVGARLAFVETVFRTEHPIALTARIDRAYRMNDGSLVLVELKFRPRNVVYDSDVVQLSAQKVAVEQATGMQVASYAFVSVCHRSRWHSTRVDLLDMDQVVALAIRRQHILDWRIPPRGSPSKRLCAECAFARECDGKTWVGANADSASEARSAHVLTASAGVPRSVPLLTRTLDVDNG